MAGLYNINLEQNATYSETFTWKDGSGNAVNLTGYTPSMQIRDKSGTVLLDVGAGGYLSLNAPATDGVVNVNIPASVIASQTWRTGKYDLFVKKTSPAYSKRLLKGVVSIDSSETQ